MCGRFTITKTEQELEKRFEADFYTKVLVARYNVAPTQNSLVITNEDPGHFQAYRWGLVPFWAKDVSIGNRMINARLETAAEKPSFRSSFKKRRCLVPCDGYYEWKKTGKVKIPHLILRRDRQAFAFAGLWAQWNPAGRNGEWDPAQTIHSFTILTAEAPLKLAPIHDRVPVILRREHERHWLDNELSAVDLQELLQPYPTDELEYYTVSRAVNSPANDEPGLLEEVVYSDATGEDGVLF